MLPVEIALLRRVWFPVARLQDLSAGPAEGRLLDVDLVVYGGPDGVTVAQGMCPHRNASLATGSVADGTIACPYHGWQFASGSGALLAVPSLPPDATLPRCSLVTYRSRVAYGLVWAVLDEPYLPAFEIPGLSPDWSVVVHRELTYFEAAEWHIAWGEAAWLHCGLRALHENFADMSHFGFVHRPSMGEVGALIPEYRVERDGWNMNYVVSNQPARDSEGGSVAEVALARTNSYRMTLPSFTTIYSPRRSGRDAFRRSVRQPDVNRRRARPQFLGCWHRCNDARRVRGVDHRFVRLRQPSDERGLSGPRSVSTTGAAVVDAWPDLDPRRRSVRCLPPRLPRVVDDVRR